MRKIFISLLVIFSTATTLAAQSKLIFVIRVDDIMSRNTAILPRSIKPFEQTVEARGAKVTWAVIPHRLIEPANQNGILARELQASVQRGHEISLHGYNHICQRCNQSGHEMYCTTHKLPFTYAEQQKLIVDGLEILQDSVGVKPESFVPPGHVADSTTYHALLDEGLQWISTTAASKEYIYRTLYNLAPHGDYTWQMTAANYQSQLQAALQDIRSKGEADGYFCLLLHDYFIRQGYENGVVLKWTGELLDSVKTYYGNRVEFKTLTDAATYFEQQIVSVASKTTRDEVSFSLQQNYPNPLRASAFNASSRIDFSIPHSGYVTLKVLNLLGQEIATLVAADLAAGKHSLPWNANGLASGVYYYRLQVGELVETKRLILLK